MIFNRYALVVFFLMASCMVQAQVSSSQAWLGVSVQADLPHRWTAGLEYQARIINNIQDFNGSYYSVDLQKGLNKNFALLAEYRLSKVQSGTFSRYSLGAMLERKIWKIKADLRAMFQMRMEEFVETGMDPNNDNYLRFRFRGRYDLSKKWGVYVSFEPIYKVKDIVFIDNVREQIGFRYKMDKHLDVNLFYLNRPDYAKSYIRRFNIFGLSLNYDLKPLKQKKSGSN